jgi:hypothetical protein
MKRQDKEEIYNLYISINRREKVERRKGERALYSFTSTGTWMFPSSENSKKTDR